MAYRGDVAVDRCIEATGASAVAGTCFWELPIFSMEAWTWSLSVSDRSANSVSCAACNRRHHQLRVSLQLQAAAFSVEACSCRPRSCSSFLGGGVQL